MFGRKKGSQPSPPPSLETCARGLYDFLLASLRDERGVRVEDLISAAATLVAERCIVVAGDYDVRTHTMAPGTRVFSDKINQLLCGDVSEGDISAVPADSVFGLVRDRLAPGVYALAEFPAPHAIFRHFAASVGNKDDWGRAPLSVPADHSPFVLPLRVAFEARAKVDQLMAPLGADPAVHLRAVVMTLTEALRAVAGAIDPKIALLLAFETINGMAKTAPMTAAAMAEATKPPA